MPVDIILDLSRLLSRVLFPTPTGIDRVEMAYARGLLARVADRLHFAAVHPVGLYGRLDPDAVRQFLDDTEARWEIGEQGVGGAVRSRSGAVHQLLRLRPRAIPPKPGGRRAYVQSSPHHLDDERRVARILAREEAGMVALVHDLIPIEYPEYARPSGAAIHRKRIATIARRADAIITNSAATRDALLPFLSAKMPRPVIRVAHLGTHGQGGRSPVRVTSERPYFVCVGTIEPRKNHLMLLNLWRALALEPAPPRLVLIGRRGWENEQVIDMLERCPALADHVEELSDLPDAQVWGLVAGARALLLPSFAEGYGMPVAEALALGVPVICSDLPALREVGGDAPTYLDPLDGPAWRRAIDAHGAHKDRTGVVRPWPGWKEPSWDDHIDTVLELAEQVA